MKLHIQRYKTRNPITDDINRQILINCVVHKINYKNYYLILSINVPI